MVSTQKRKEQILREMAGIERMEKGRLTAEYRERVEEGKTIRQGPYYKHQCWEQGRNLSRRVPAEQAEELREAVEGYHKFKELSEQYVELSIEMTRNRAGSAQGKKKPR